MEITQGISLDSHLLLKRAKSLSFSFYHICLFSSKIGEQEGRTDSAKRQMGVKGRENVAQVVYTHISKC
jgi:hypothetical protein